MKTFEDIIEKCEKTVIKGFTLPVMIENVMPGDTITISIEVIRKTFDVK